MWLTGLAAGLLLGWLLLPTPLWICGVYNSSATPAWVQAVGSVLAIFVATAIPWWQEKMKRDETGKQLSIAILRLRSNLQALGVAAMGRAAELRGFEIKAGRPGTAKDVREVLAITTIQPEISQVDSRIEKVHHFEPRIQKPILDLLEEYDYYSAEHSRVWDTNDVEIVERMKQYKSGLVLRLETISQHAFAAFNAIKLAEEERKSPDLRARNTFWRNIAKREGGQRGKLAAPARNDS